MLLALSTANKIGLIASAAVFVVYALVSALVIPRYRPDFPGSGRGLRLYVTATAVLFLGMLAAVVVFGREPREAEAAGSTAGTTTQAATTTGTSTTAPSPAAVAEGKKLYASLGCQACHSIDGSSGVGPTWKGLAGSQVELASGQTVTADQAYLLESIEQPDAQIVSGFKPGIMSGTIKPGSVSKADAQALIAFIQSLG